jgi:hypothetical protein
LQKERRVIEKKFMLKKHRKNVLQSKSIEKKRERKHDPLQNKGKRRISKQGVLRKTNKYSTHLHMSIKLHD